MSQEVLLVAVGVLVGLWKAAQTFGLIPAGPVARAAQDRAKAAEIEVTGLIERRGSDQAKIAALEARTDLSPLVAVVEKTSTQLDDVATRLETLDGTMAAAAAAHERAAGAHEETAKALQLTGEAMRFLATANEARGQ